MNTTLEQTSLTPAIVKGKLAIALTKAEQSVQALHDAESKLVYNEENLATIKNFIDEVKKAAKIVETKRKQLKEPYLQASRIIDDGAKLLSNDLDLVLQKASAPYQKLCQEVERKRREAEAETARVKGIQDAMNNFRMEYSQKIAAAKSSSELVAIERLVNLESANARKYAEFLENFKTSCEPLRIQLRTQKERVRELEEIELKRQEAEKRGNDEEILQLMEKQEVLGAKIEENKEIVQEVAVSQAIQSETTVTEIIPTVPRGTRRYMRWEMVDEKAATKAKLTMVVPDKDKIEEILRDKRENGEEVTENGIRYYYEIKF